MSHAGSWSLRPAQKDDVSSIFKLIQELAKYEKALDRVETNKTQLETTLFGERPYAEVILAIEDGEAIGMALFVSRSSD